MRYLNFKPLPIIIALGILANGAKSCGSAFSLGCDLTANIEYIESSCGLTNGVRFEELQIIAVDSANSPGVYKVLSSFECYNPGVEEGQKFWPDKLYFNKPNGHYVWRTDTSTNGFYVRKGYYRDEIQNADNITDSVLQVKIAQAQKNRNNIPPKTNLRDIKPGLQSYTTCPAKFKPNTWYFLNFYDQRYEAYLFVDNEFSFRIEKISLPTNF